MNYAELQELIEDTLESEEESFVDNIPNFVKAAEDDIFKNTQITSLRKNSTGSATANTPYVATPDDFLSPYSLAIVVAGEHFYLLNREVDFLREAFPAAATTGVPKYYSLFDHDTIILAPTPTEDYDLELHYYYHPESIVTASTSWLGTNAPNALLYGSLVHGYVYLKGEGDLLQYYRDEYLRALSNLQVLTEGRMRKDTYRKPNAREET